MNVIEQAQAIREAMDIAGATLTDEKALECIRLYREWEAGKKYVEGEFFTYGVNSLNEPQLYKARKEHTSQKEHPPGQGTESLYIRIDNAHAGTLEDPIPYDGNMALEAGKYYSQDGVVYLCTRDTVNPVYHALAELVGLYVEVA